MSASEVSYQSIRCNCFACSAVLRGSDARRQMQVFQAAGVRRVKVFKITSNLMVRMAANNILRLLRTPRVLRAYCANHHTHTSIKKIFKSIIYELLPTVLFRLARYMIIISVKRCCTADRSIYSYLGTLIDLSKIHSCV